MSGPRYNVIFRTCDAVHSLRGSRVFDLDKLSIIKICFLSLYQALTGFPHHIHILGDKLSQEAQGFFRIFLADDSVSFSNGNYGNDESIRQSIARALSLPDDEWVYFCEDDYLHLPQSFQWIDDLIRNRDEILRFQPGRKWMRGLFRDVEKRPLFIHPSDYPDRYQPDHRQFGLLFLGTYNHWRQISNTTFTFLGEVKSLKKYEKALRESADGARDDYLSRHLFSHVFFFGRGLCISPIPGVATHMTEGAMTPLVDWKSILQPLRGRIERLERNGLASLA